MNWPETHTSVLQEPLEPCSTDPMSGFTRNGCCETGPGDLGSHTVCVQVSEAFLEFSKENGNDLSTPRPEFGFQCLTEGDRWCLCASRWLEALKAGVAPRVFMKSTHEKALDIIAFVDLKDHALDLS